MSRAKWIGLAVGILATTVAATAMATDETIEDDLFSEADWTLVVLRDDTLTGNAGFIGVQQSTGGNPGDYRFVANSWTHDGNGLVSVVAGHLRTTADYRPTTQGEVGTVEFSFDLRTTATTYQTESLLLAFPLIGQNDAYYAPGAGAEGTEQWGTFTSGVLEETDFTRYAGDSLAPNTPDFSGLGAPLTFGFAVSVGPHALAGGYSTEGGLDNFAVSIREPGSVADAGAGGSSGAGGSGSQGSGSLPSGQPGTVVPREDSGCSFRPDRSAPGGQDGARWWWLAIGGLWVASRRR